MLEKASIHIMAFVTIENKSLARFKKFIRVSPGDDNYKPNQEFFNIREVRTNQVEDYYKF